MSDLPVSIHVDMVDVLFGFDGLPSRFAKHTSELSGGLLPLGSRQSLGANNELAVGGDGNDQLSHVAPLSFKSGLES
jgi:hypothetical protein